MQDRAERARGRCPAACARRCSAARCSSPGSSTASPSSRPGGSFVRAQEPAGRAALRRGGEPAEGGARRASSTCCAACSPSRGIPGLVVVFPVLGGRFERYPHRRAAPGGGARRPRAPVSRRRPARLLLGLRLPRPARRRRAPEPARPPRRGPRDPRRAVRPRLAVRGACRPARPARPTARPTSRPSAATDGPAPFLGSEGADRPLDSTGRPGSDSQHETRVVRIRPPAPRPPRPGVPFRRPEGPSGGPGAPARPAPPLRGRVARAAAQGRRGHAHAHGRGAPDRRVRRGRARSKRRLRQGNDALRCSRRWACPRWAGEACSASASSRGSSSLSRTPGP